MNLPTLILASLKANKRTPITGYDLTKKVNALENFLWRSSHQQVYRELGKLETLGYVSHTVVPQAGKPDRKDYTITKLGKTHLAEVSTEPSKLPTTRDKLAAQLVATETQSPELSQKLLTDYMEKQEKHIKLMKGDKVRFESDWLMSSLLERQIQLAELDVAWVNKIVESSHRRVSGLQQ